jgi:hypothetical protein
MGISKIWPLIAVIQDENYILNYSRNELLLFFSF